MLTFFRRIRKGLIGLSQARKSASPARPNGWLSGQAGRYILYAIGEIALVVIGILIALQINNWNEQRKTRIEEQILLEEIGENIKSSFEVLNNSINSIKNNNQKIQILIRHMKFDLPYHDSLESYFYNIHSFSTPQFSSSGYENLKSRGVGIVSNRNLRKNIIETFDQVLPEVAENFIYDGRLRHQEYHNSYYTKNFLILSEEHGDSISHSDQYLGITGAAKPIDYDQLTRDISYESILRSLFNNNQWFVNYANCTIEDLVELLSAIEEELNNK